MNITNKLELFYPRDKDKIKRLLPLCNKKKLLYIKGMAWKGAPYQNISIEKIDELKFNKFIIDKNNYFILQNI